MSNYLAANILVFEVSKGLNSNRPRPAAAQGPVPTKNPDSPHQMVNGLVSSVRTTSLTLTSQESALVSLSRDYSDHRLCSQVKQFSTMGAVGFGMNYGSTRIMVQVAP